MQASDWLKQLDPNVQRVLRGYAFNETAFLQHQSLLQREGYDPAMNYVKEDLAPASTDDVLKLPARGSVQRLELEIAGAKAIAAGQVAAVVLAGGMATRFGGQVKALVDVHGGRSFADIKLAGVAAIAQTYSMRIPMWWMTSFATDGRLREWLQVQSQEHLQLRAFSQSVSLRLTPAGEVVRSDDALYAPGHGDLVPSLQRSGLLEKFVADGGRYVFISNVDNLVATLDPAVIGAHIKSGEGVTVETVRKHPGDKGGAPAWLNDRLQVVEAFRFPPDFDQDSIPVFNTNTFVVDAPLLCRDYDFDAFAVSKTVAETQVIQFERLFGQITAFVDSNYLEVEREGRQTRFIPVKTPADLDSQRAHILAALGSR